MSFPEVSRQDLRLRRHSPGCHLSAITFCCHCLTEEYRGDKQQEKGILVWTPFKSKTLETSFFFSRIFCFLSAASSHLFSLLCDNNSTSKNLCNKNYSRLWAKSYSCFILIYLPNELDIVLPLYVLHTWLNSILFMISVLECSCPHPKITKINLQEVRF